MLRRLFLLLLVLVASTLVPASPAAAHNTLVSSDPATGSTLATAPTQLTLVFDKNVPLDTVSIELIDAAGVRSDLSGLSHGPTGSTEVVAPLPALPAGVVNLRWRLVGPDGHPITGRISITITAPVETTPTTVVPALTPVDPTTTTAAAIPPSDMTTTTLPAVVIPESAPTSEVVSPGSSFDDFPEPYSTSSSMRWLLRMVSYFGIMTVLGVLATVMFVWPRAWGRHLVRQSVRVGIVSASIAGILQLLVLASDISGESPWASTGSISDSLSIDAGKALVLRLVLLPVLAWVMFVDHPSVHPIRWLAAAGITTVLLGTWAYAGHSQSMRWPWLGIPLDVAHHAAAGAWIGGLAIVGIVTLRDSDQADLVGAVGRFGRVASLSVGILVGTGILQAIRLVGDPTKLLDADHGRYLLIKVLVLAVMLKVADVNRQRVHRRFNGATAAPPRRVAELLRRAMGTELAVGVVIIGVTAALVVSPPAVADSGTARSTALASETQPTVSTPTTSPTPRVSIMTSTTLAPTSAASCQITEAVLALGASGPSVLCLQQALAAAGFYAGPLSSSFDEATATSVRTAQQQLGLFVDGIVGETTAGALNIWPSE